VQWPWLVQQELQALAQLLSFRVSPCLNFLQELVAASGRAAWLPNFFSRRLASHSFYLGSLACHSFYLGSLTLIWPSSYLFLLSSSLLQSPSPSFSLRFLSKVSWLLLNWYQLFWTPPTNPASFFKLQFPSSVLWFLHLFHSAFLSFLPASQSVRMLPSSLRFQIFAFNWRPTALTVAAVLPASFRPLQDPLKESLAQFWSCAAESLDQLLRLWWSTCQTLIICSSSSHWSATTPDLPSLCLGCRSKPCSFQGFAWSGRSGIARSIPILRVALKTLGPAPSYDESTLLVPPLRSRIYWL